MNDEEKIKFYIYTINALNGMIYKEIVKINSYFDFKKKKLFFRVYLDREPSEFDKNVMCDITTEILSNYSEKEMKDIDEKCMEYDSKYKEENYYSFITFYRRMEKRHYSIYEPENTKDLNKKKRESEDKTFWKKLFGE